MNIFDRTLLTEMGFAAMIADLEHRDGLIIFPADRAPARCVLKFIGHTPEGRPAAVYSVPGEAGFALVVADTLQRSPYIAKWMTEEEMRSVIPTIGDDGHKRHDKKAHRKVLTKA